MKGAIVKEIAGLKENYVKFFVSRNGLIHDPNPQETLNNVLEDSRIKTILDELSGWPCYEIKTHKDVAHPLHKLSFIAELGFTKEDPGIREILDKILQNQSEEGLFQLLVNVPKSFGGTGTPLMTWVMSDAPPLIYAVIKLNNLEITDRIKEGIDFIANAVADNGWRCAAGKELGRFRGPGRKSDPCPYATMFSLKMLSLTNETLYVRAKKIGLDTIFDLWDRRGEYRPYLFGIGTDFKKLKLPLVWYDILNVVDTLSRYNQAVKDERFIEMMTIIREKKTDGGYIPESIYLKSKEWDFGQKKKPSEFMNAVVHRIERRIEASES
jgi:hypothetical protein